MPHQPAITLTDDERTTLESFVHRGKANGRTITRARILQRLEFHYTPKHGSWLNIAEIEIAILERNAFSQRLPDETALRHQVLAVETERNAGRRGIPWQFTSRDVRRKLERLYPVKEGEAVRPLEAE
jgi:hypothetical protein